MECMICGKETKKIFKIEVEGSLIEVCENCAKEFGNIVKIENFEKNKKESKRIPEFESEEVELVEDYNEKIREVREKMKLTLKEAAEKIGIKESILSKIERGELIPDKKTLEKIEKFFKIKLEEKVEYKKLKSHDKEEKLRIADVVEIK